MQISKISNSQRSPSLVQINNNTLPKLKFLKTVNKKTYQTVFVVLIADIRIKVSSGAQPSIPGYQI